MLIIIVNCSDLVLLLCSTLWGLATFKEVRQLDEDKLQTEKFVVTKDQASDRRGKSMEKVTKRVGFAVQA